MKFKDILRCMFSRTCIGLRKKDNTYYTIWHAVCDGLRLLMIFVLLLLVVLFLFYRV